MGGSDTMEYTPATLWAMLVFSLCSSSLLLVNKVCMHRSQLRRRRPQGNSQLQLLRYRQLMLYQHWRLRLRFQWLLTFSRTRMSAKKVQQA